MTTDREPPPKPKDTKAKASRDDRLKAALKANMARRKAQARARDGARDAMETGAASPDKKE